MARKHLFVVVVLLGAAAVAGLLAVTRTVSLGATPAPAQTAQIAAKERSLDQLEASLRRALAKPPPALPSASPTTAPSAAPRTVYLRPAPSAGAYEDEHGEHDDDEGAESADD
jgi:hypothetical protein